MKEDHKKVKINQMEDLTIRRCDIPHILMWRPDMLGIRPEFPRYRNPTRPYPYVNNRALKIVEENERGGD